MLPSTGYFKGISCPFYDNGLCERPYCHFRHVKKESQNASHDRIESGAILQKLVSAAVQKVLQQTESSGVMTDSPELDAAANVSKNNTQNVRKLTYNPTPISELKKIITDVDSENKDEIIEQRKRHIPVPYTPRKPTNLPIKRSIDTNGSSQPLLYIPPPIKYTPGSTESVQLDPYTPKGTVDSEGKYLPGSETEIQQYQPDETQKTASKHNYVPSDKNVSKKKILEYKPAKVSSKTETSNVTYQPTPRSLAPCFSSDEDEPDNKKRKLSSDLNGLDELGEEFDILDQILDEEKSVSDCDINKITQKKDEKQILESGSKDCDKITVNEDAKKSHKSHKNDKREKSKEKISESKKDDKQKTKSKEDHSKSRSKKSSKNDKDRDSKSKSDKSKHESDKKKYSSSRGSQESTKDSKHKTSRNHANEKDSKHSSKSKSEIKHKDKDKDKNDHKSSSRKSNDKKKHKKTKEKEKNNVPDNGVDCHDYIDSNNEELYELSESDEESRALECKRIFEEYVPTEKKSYTEETVTITEDTAEDKYIPTKKRISRTTDKNIKIIPKAPMKPDFKVNAAQAMAERVAKVKEFHDSKIKSETMNENSNKIDVFKNMQTPPVSSSKIRIAHVPYASTLMNAKKTISPNVNEVKIQPSTSSTISQTIKKGVQRIAHMPKDKFIDRPGVLEPLGSKIPANIRSTYLNMMIDESLKIYLSATDAYARAQHEELTTSKKCSTVQIYKNSAVLTVSRLRKEFQECNGTKKSGSDCSTLQKIPKVFSSNTINAGSWSIESKNKRIGDQSKEFSGVKLYNNIKKWILTEDQLHENGFPRPHPSGEKGRAIIYGQKKQNPPKGYIRTCCRCKKDYTVDKKGFAAITEECIYHPNNKYRVRGEVRYQCCSQDGMSDGCCVAPSHVYEYVDYENLKGYIKTMPSERELEDYGVYSLDCEMCYTTQGLDLTRVTVINSDCKVVYETLIKPLHSIVDYNTRYSGITEEQMKGIKTTLLEVQATLLTMFNSKTILIGHSLESDFKALKLIHDTVIDTSVLFPHKMGPPYKRALRNLSSEHLKKIIQNSVDGHDSAEDATVCMELIHFKLKEDLKTR